MAQARVLSRKLVFHYTPKHGSWLNSAEIEFSALARQGLNRRTGSLDELAHQVEIWTNERNERAVNVHCSFTDATRMRTNLNGGMSSLIRRTNHQYLLIKLEEY